MQDIIVIGASAGGVEAVKTLVATLPADLNAALFVVIHFPSHATSVLPHILNRAGTLPASHPEDGEEIKKGHIYVAIPDWHLLVEPGVVHLTRGPRENRHRPAIDVTFRSAALSYGPRVIGIVLSGTMDDGTAGLSAIKSRGGITICQDPADADYPDMPRNAIEQVGVDHVLPLAKMPDLLQQLTSHREADMNTEPTHDPLERETLIAALDWKEISRREPPGDPSSYACPNCGGVLWEVHDGELTRYRCRVGHAYSPVDLLESQENAVESALWSALRALEERASLLHRMKHRAQDNGNTFSAERFELQEREAVQRATLLHNVLQSGGIATLTSTQQRPTNGKEVGA